MRTQSPAVNEFELIKRYLRDRRQHPSICLGSGDDCAVLQVPPGKQLAVSMDTLVADVHFPRDAPAQDIATRALCVNLSDLAAMGAQPLWFTLSLTLPKADEHWLQAFSRGLFQIAELYECILVGGDLSRGPLSITIQVHGAVDTKTPLSRRHAQVGDRVYVTGSLGDGAAALALLKDEPAYKTVAYKTEDKNYLHQRFYRPLPQCQVGQGLVGIASACIDISDGLLADLGHICEDSEVNARIEVEALPISPQVRALAQEQAQTWALNGGDDYQLCFTVAQGNLEAFNARRAHWDTPITDIGVIVESTQNTTRVNCYRQGKRIQLPLQGYQHFA